MPQPENEINIPSKKGGTKSNTRSRSLAFEMQCRLRSLY